jgi:hypothetical protein
LAGAISPGYPAEALDSAGSNIVTLPGPKGGSKRGIQSRLKHWTRPLYSTKKSSLIREDELIDTVADIVEKFRGKSHGVKLGDR